MAQRSNPPRRVRRKLVHNPSSASDNSTRRVSNEDTGHSGATSRSGQDPLRAKKVLLCLDYGTTLTSISYITFDPDNPPEDVEPRAIRCIANWPEADRWVRPGTPFVPSESWYRDGKCLWGYEVQNRLRSLSDEDDVESINCVVQLPKLLLDDEGEDLGDSHLAQTREALRNVGKSARDAIRDYLFKVFKHTHGQLGKSEGFDNNTWEVELALCVPSKWSTYAQLTMQEILLEVLDRTDMKGRVFSMFIIDEPEAAVTFALRHNIPAIEKGSNFVVCDAGGGTVDAITYRVRTEDPFRFDEIATPAGKDCGSSYINQAFIEETRGRLVHITDLGKGADRSKEAVLQRDFFRPFENELKRICDPACWEDGESRELYCVGLTPDSTRNFGNGLFFITKDQMHSYFQRSLEGTMDLISEQLNQLQEEDQQEVKAILLLGGFSKSPALNRCLHDAFGQNGRSVIHLDWDIDMTTAASRGGVLRALNKKDGPRRKLRLNLGVCLSEPYNNWFKGHREGRCIKNPLNKEKYAKDCMDWVIRKDRIVKDRESASIHMHRVFKASEELSASETIYFSDQHVFRHYSIDHSRNYGHRKAGVVEASLDVLRERNMLEEKVNEVGDVYYQVHYSMKLEVDGRNVRATIHCPPGEDVQGEAQICIAAAFSPGTE